MTYERIFSLKCNICGKHIGYSIVNREVECKDDNPHISKIIYKNNEEVIDLICDQCYEKVKDNYCN